MRLSGMIAGIGLAALITTGAHAALNDGVHIVSGPTTVFWSQGDESHEYFQALQAFVAPSGFVDGTVYLMEPPTEPQGSILGTGISDAFSLIRDPTTNHVNVYFISDGATADELSQFVASTNVMRISETGQWQDVSSFFGQGAGFAQVVSDVPEPAAWALMIAGFAGLGMVLRRRKTAVLSA